MEGWRKALGWSLFWIFLALLFNAGIWHQKGSEAALQFLTAYVVEKSLSIDNIFVFLMIFNYFKVKDAHQHKILHWGVMSALVMRAVFIFSGVALIQRFHWIIYVFGLFLVFTSIRILIPKEESVRPEGNFLVRIMRKWVPMLPAGSSLADSGRFFVRKDGKLYATQLLMVLIMIETSDLIFAVDSIPAVISVTPDPFLVYTSNIFAIMGLRSLYFVIASIMPMFKYLKYGLSVILGFVGVKMLISEYVEIPVGIALGFIVMSLTISILASLLGGKRFDRTSSSSSM